MRDIKFRGFTINEEKYGNGKDGWIYGNLLLSDNKKAQIQDVNDDNFFKFIDIKSIGQYTGLKDKNGKEIYEGDIVKFRFKEDREEFPDLIGYIEYQSTFAAFRIMSNQGSFKIDITEIKFIEVIGNIYDNKNLLEEGE